MPNCMKHLFAFALFAAALTAFAQEDGQLKPVAARTDSGPARSDTTSFMRYHRGVSDRPPQTYFQSTEILEQEINLLYRLLARSEQGTNDDAISYEQHLQRALARRAVVNAQISVHEQTGEVPKEWLERERRRLADLDGAIDLLKELVEKEAARNSKGTDILAGRFAEIDFYGRVLDQNDKPAPNVTVTVLLDTVSPDPATFFSARKDIQVKTDEQGFFEYHGFGEKIFVSVHSQEGYERTTGLNPSEFQYGGAPGAVFTKHIPDKNKPVVFRVRKKEEPVPLIFKYYSNDRFPFSRVFQLTGYFDMFQESTTYEYYDEQAQPVRDWKESGFRPQFSITQTLLKNEVDEQIKQVEIRFYGGIAFLYSPTDIFRDVYRMDPALKCTGRDSFTFWIRRKRNPDGTAAEYSFSENGKDWPDRSASGEDSNQLDRQCFWVEFPGEYFGRLRFTGMNSFPEKDPAAERARIGVRLELNTIPGNRVFERDGMALWDRKKTAERKELLQTILAPFNGNTTPFFPEE